jgi:hypothetical protein
MGRGLSRDPSPGAVPCWPCTLLRCFGLRSGSVCCSCLAETLPSRRRDPTVAGGGYSQSLPPCSHALQMVPTPLLTHLTLERRQRRQAMLERIRPGACVGDGPAAALCRPVVDMVAVLEVRGPAGSSEDCTPESASRACSRSGIGGGAVDGRQGVGVGVTRAEQRRKTWPGAKATTAPSRGCEA